MADTERADFADAICSDCGVKGCDIKHWGKLVPPGVVVFLCEFCWQQRMEASGRGEAPKPLGIKPPGVPKEFWGKSIEVTTQSVSVYKLEWLGDERVWTISRKRKKEGEKPLRELPFDKAEVLCLAVGQYLWLRYPDGDGYDLLRTTAVVSIEPGK